MIKALLIDFDGVMTDNRVYVDENGIESVCCNRSDGLGIGILKNKNIKMAIISTESNKVVAERAKKVDIPVYQSVEDKGIVVKRFCEENNVGLHEVAFVGNDINDLSAFEIVNKKICPKDSVIEIKSICDHVLSSKGGEGVIREISDKFNIIFLEQ